jgi:hypothetical protein
MNACAQTCRYAHHVFGHTHPSGLAIKAPCCEATPQVKGCMRPQAWKVLSAATVSCDHGAVILGRRGISAG